MQNRYQILLEKHLDNIKSNKIVNLDPTLDSSYLNDVNNVTYVNGKKANTTNKQVSILPSDNATTAIINY